MDFNYINYTEAFEQHAFPLNRLMLSLGIFDIAPTSEFKVNFDYLVSGDQDLGKVRISHMAREHLMVTH
ncbi:hypothetical protein [Aeromonas veronii]|uniref:hypothetical protein n=1 Tax=Aeromonas veronii TaxID=654 RepID=UPI00214DB36D|nr:hypothetical protein [Aeromonas veronii]MCR3969436.1 hypothetical protein [Aeromonas veronii]MCR3981910.1 hypothetical protein [Aeromonas veronii]